MQGDRTVGITEIPAKDFLDRLQAHYGFEPPREPGHNVVSALEAMVRGESRVFIALGKFLGSHTGLGSNPRGHA